MSATATERQTTITRTIQAPRELVFAAWTDPAQLPRWYAPTGCTIEFRKLDVREGGEFHSCITIPGGKQCWCKGTYLELIAPERIVQTMTVCNERGDDVEPAEVGMDPLWPRETTLTVTFGDAGKGKTLLTLHQTVSEALAMKTGAQPSWLVMLDRLEALLAGGTQ
jgi:uncharacterized protein YndB with AHSA1/START domain